MAYEMYIEIITLFTEIGPGWIPAIINSEIEHALILEKQKILNNNQSYWIAGSTRTIGDIDYVHYRPYEAGAGISVVLI